MSNESCHQDHRAVLVLPHIRIQNANAISSPMTWGFPAITAFTGLMTALERRLGRNSGIALYGIGVICHGFEAQVTKSGYTRAFHLTRNPVLQDGSTAGIVEEGRVHLELTLVMDARLVDENHGEAERGALATRVAHELAGMRLAGGSMIPALAGPSRRPTRPLLELVPDDGEPAEQRKHFRRLSRRWLPGFALVSRDDLLQARLAEMRADDPATTVLDAWMDLSRWTSRAVKRAAMMDNSEPPAVDWVADSRPGWIVPIPVGFAALSKLHEPGAVLGTRDVSTPFRFVETVWSVGQWISPHRLERLSDVFWVSDHDQDPKHVNEDGLYRCRNPYQPSALYAEPAETPDSTNH